MAMTNEEMPQTVWLCDNLECSAIHYEEPTTCETCCCSVSEIDKGDLGYID